MKQVFFILAIVAATVCSGKKLSPYYTGNVLPTPRQIISKWQKYPISAESFTIRTNQKPVKSVKLIKKLLVQRIKNYACRKVSNKAITLYLGKINTKIFDEFSLDISAIKNKEQGYLIRVIERDNETVVLAAGNDNRGVFYAAVTIFQLIGKSENQCFLKLADINDWPVWKERCMSDFLPLTYDWLIQNLLLYKVNCYALQTRGHAFGPDKKTPYGNWNSWKEGLTEMKKLRDETGLIDYMFVHNIYANRGRNKNKRSFNIANESHIQKLIDDCLFVADYGVNHIMIGVDDYVPQKNGKYIFAFPEEKRKFNSVGQAHGYLMRRLYKVLKEKYPNLTLAFCPAPYSLNQHRAYQQPGKGYLNALTKEMPKDIFVVWTGRNIVSMQVTKKDFQGYSKLINGHPLYSWHNPRIIHRIGTLPNFRLYPGYEKDSHGIFFANSHNAAKWESASGLCFASYSWNPDKYEFWKVYEDAVRKLFGIKDAAPVKKLIEGMKNLSQTRKKQQRVKLIKELQHTLAEINKLKLGLKTGSLKKYLAEQYKYAMVKHPTIAAPRLNARQIIIDGSLNEEVWDKANTFMLNDSLGKVVKHNPTKCKIFNTGDAIFLGITAFNKKQGNISLFLYPANAKHPRWARFAVDSEGKTSAAYRWGYHKNWRPAWKASVKQGKKCWIAEMKIPFKAIAQSPVFWRNRVRANEVWNAQLILSHVNSKDFQSWSPLGNKKDIKRPACELFGKIIFK